MIGRYELAEQLVSAINHAKKMGEVGITVHRHADLDAITSAYALQQTFFPSSPIIIHDNPNTAASKFIVDFSVKDVRRYSPELDAHRKLIVVDGSTPEMYPTIDPSNVVLIIDHHKPAERSIDAPTIRDADARAVAEMFALAFPTLSPRVASALAIGIVADCAMFRTARPLMFAALHRCLSAADLEYEDVVRHAFPERSIDDKLIILNACNNLRVFTVKNYAVAIAVSNNNESDVSSFLSEVADISLVFGEHENEVRVSGRSRNHVPLKLNEFMSTLGAKCSGTGGGHIHAAGATLHVGLKDAIEVAIDLLNTMISDDNV